MNPEDTLEQFEIEENKGISKSSHTKNPTTCNDVRRSGEACGICGSRNVVSQGVRYCKSCDLEVEWLGEYRHYWWNSGRDKPICNCAYIVKNKRKVSPRDSHFILKCIDCGAVNSTKLCPNCGGKSSSGSGTWKHWDGRIKCRICGFAIDNAIYCGMGAKTNKAQGKLGTKKAKKKYMSKRQKRRYEAKNKQHSNKIK
jgi:hypothetical protein